MQKIPTLFLRNPERPGIATEEVNPDAEWVTHGEGVATRKWDGTACLFYDGLLYKRLHWPEKKGSPPAGWLHWSKNPEQRNGHGWLPVGDGAEDWMHNLGLQSSKDNLIEGATYELCGPKINKNAEHLDEYVLLVHGSVAYPSAPRTFTQLKDFLKENAIEGLVWHHPDGYMAKIKRRDFSIPWPV